MDVNQGIESIVLEATVFRADTGKTEDLGPIAEYNSNPKKRSTLLPGISIKNPILYSRYLASKGR